MTEPVPVSVAGLRIPGNIAPRLIAAIRRRYPDQTAPETDDNAAVRAALIAWCTELLVESAQLEAEVQRNQAHQSIDDQFIAQVETLRQQAQAAAGTITEAVP